MINADTVLAQRTQRGLSQRQLAKRAGVSYMTISRMENGSDTSDLPLSVVGRLAEALDLEPGDLLCGRDRSASSSPMRKIPAAGSVLDEAPLNHSVARLLRRIHRGDDVRRTMSRADREIILPALVNGGLVIMTQSGASIADFLASSLSATHLSGQDYAAVTSVDRGASGGALG